MKNFIRNWTARTFVLRVLLILSSIILLGIGIQLFYIYHVLHEADYLLSVPPVRLYVGICLINGFLLLTLWAGIWKLYHHSLIQPTNILAPIIRDIQAQELAMVAYFQDTGCNEIQTLAKATHQMLQRNNTLVTQVNEAWQKILEASRNTFASSKNQSQLLASQTESSTEMASAIRELVVTTEHISDDVRAVVDLAKQTLRVTEQGQHSVMTVVKSMEDIRHSSQISSNKIMALSKQSGHINEVVKTIDRIIEDTKLIAFNATIEAARAKDEGKGFGVVSLEIKRLAEEVFESTEAIKDLIQDIQETSHALVLAHEEEMKTVRRGTLLVEEAGNSLQQIFEMVRLTTDSAQRIAAATQQQQGANTQVLQSVESANQSMRQFSQESKQLARTSAELNILAEGLGQILTGFIPLQGSEEHGGRTSHS